MRRVWLWFMLAMIAYAWKTPEDGAWPPFFDDGTQEEEKTSCEEVATRMVLKEIEIMEKPMEEVIKDPCYKCGKLLALNGWCNDFKEGDTQGLINRAKQTGKNRNVASALLGACESCTCGACPGAAMALTSCMMLVDPIIQRAQLAKKGDPNTDKALGYMKKEASSIKADSEPPTDTTPKP